MDTPGAQKEAAPVGTPKRKRRFRFTLRRLMVFVAIFAIVLGWYVHRVREQQRAVEVVSRLGGTVWYAWPGVGISPERCPIWMQRVFSAIGEDYLFPVWGVKLSKRRATDADLKQLEPLRHLSYLELKGTDITDAGLVYLKGFPKLNNLHLDGTRVSDDGMDTVATFHRLSMLSIPNTTITDVGLAKLSGKTKMRMLVLDATGVTGDGLAHLAAMDRLEQLYLSDTQVHGSGLEILTRLPRLNFVALNNTAISDSDVPVLKTLGAKKVGVTVVGATDLSDAAKRELASSSPFVKAR